ncbi:hypothetical protein PG996_009797 [Apiospora saccharicola]|uniref:BTB domain-containing protein n=1 Tax=Apiospora saccharicola TaxID=335842 RepID=A0ABR1ULT6_9PEZI
MDPTEEERFKDFSLDGDVIFVVGGQKKARLKVNSQYLCCASTVFRAMFGPNWSEDQGLSKESPKDVPLAEDDPDALYAIMCVIHHRNDLVPAEISPQELLQIAIAADKYDLSVALTFARAQWLQHQSKDIAVSKYMACLMAAAFLFDNQSNFIEYGQALMLRHAGSYMLRLNDKALRQALPVGLPRTLHCNACRE